MSNDEPTDIKWLKELFSEMRESQKDLREEMRNGFTQINERLEMYQENFETKENATSRREAIHTEISKLDNEKASKESVSVLMSEIDDINKLKNKIIWLVLSTVIVAILALVITEPF